MSQAGGQGTQVQGAEVVGVQGQGLQLRQTLVDDVLNVVSFSQMGAGLQMSLDSDSVPRKLEK